MSFEPARKRVPEYRHLRRAIKQVTFRNDKPVRREFRASSSPYCSILDLISYLENRRAGNPGVTYDRQFYFSVGHVIHDLWQNVMVQAPKYGHRVYGDWVCSKCGKLVKHSTRPKYQCCKTGHWGYQELTYRYRGLSGHSDLITKVDKRNYTLWELKTVPHWFLESMKLCSEYQMYAKSLTQVRVYAALARKLYKLPITRVVIVNLGRESSRLKYMKLNGVKFTDKDYRKVMRQLDHDVAARKSVTRLLKYQDWKRPPREQLREVVKNRPCFTRDDYYSKMDQRWFGKDRCPVYKLKLCTKQPDHVIRQFLSEIWAGTSSGVDTSDEEQ